MCLVWQDGFQSLCGNLLSRRPAAKQAAEKVPKARHSERSEESLFGLSPRDAMKEGFLASLGMTGLFFFPQPVKPHTFYALYGTAEAVPYKEF